MTAYTGPPERILRQVQSMTAERWTDLVADAVKGDPESRAGLIEDWMDDDATVAAVWNDRCKAFTAGWGGKSPRPCRLERDWHAWEGADGTIHRYQEPTCRRHRSDETTVLALEAQIVQMRSDRSALAEELAGLSHSIDLTRRIAMGESGIGWVYRIGVGTLWKIGYSRNPAKRLGEIQSGKGVVLYPHGLRPSVVRLASAIPGDQRTERRFHAALAHRNVIGEWFSIRDQEAEDYLTRYGLTA